MSIMTGSPSMTRPLGVVWSAFGPEATIVGADRLRSGFLAIMYAPCSLLPTWMAGGQRRPDPSSEAPTDERNFSSLTARRPSSVVDGGHPDDVNNPVPSSL